MPFDESEPAVKDRLLAARCSLILLIVGPFIPVLALVLRSGDAGAFAALGCGAIVELLALVLGIVGVRHLPGKIGLFGSLVILVAFGMVLPLVLFRSDAKKARELSSEHPAPRHSSPSSQGCAGLQS